VSAGPITVTGGPAPLTVLPADAGLVDNYASGAIAFAPGDMLTIAGNGSQDVPAFGKVILH
jgi:hypothetical protein